MKGGYTMKKISRKITKSGSLSIPRRIQHDTGIRAGVPVDILPQEDGSLMVTKHTPVCYICGGADNTVEHSGYCLCRECLTKMVKEIERHD